MKKFLLLIIVIISLMYINVNADTNIGKLVGVGSTIDVNTDYFQYTNINYVNSNDNGMFVIDSVTNKSSEKIPVSINILLFDANKKNIGYVTYCTDKDYESDYAQLKLSSLETTGLTINVVSKYFIDEKGHNDVKYFAVFDDNKYCQIGGYKKYSGLSIDEIMESGEKLNKDPYSFISIKTKLIKWWSGVNYCMLFYGIFFTLIYAFITGAILNLLAVKKDSNKYLIAYIPGLSNYLAVKLAFGKIIGTIYFIVGLICLIFILNPLSIVGLGVLGIISGIAFLIDIIKIITGKYNLCIIGSDRSSNISRERKNISTRNFSNAKNDVSNNTKDDNKKNTFIQRDSNIDNNVSNDNVLSEAQINSGHTDDINDDVSDDNISVGSVESNDSNVSDSESNNKEESNLTDFFN